MAARHRTPSWPLWSHSPRLAGRLLLSPAWIPPAALSQSGCGAEWREGCPFVTAGAAGSPCSDSDEEESTKEDNTALLRFHLKYEADVLFTRWAGAPGPCAEVLGDAAKCIPKSAVPRP